MSQEAIEAMRAGKSVITANKALLAECGEDIFKTATEHQTDLFYEATVGGGIPVIKALREGLVANHIDSIYGILNGTCNYILTRMERDGNAFDEVLKDAQELGFAEADPAVMARILKRALLIVGAGVLVFLAVTGRLGAAFGGLAGLTLLALRWHGIWRQVKQAKEGYEAFRAGGGAGSRGQTKKPRNGNMTRREALEILGLEEGADEAAIRDAHHRLMVKIHPDQGGSNWLATRINQARDLLLGE